MTNFISRAQKDILDFYPEYLREKEEQEQKLTKQRFETFDSIQKAIARQKLLRFSSKE